MSSRKGRWARAGATLTPLPAGPTDQARTSALPALSSVSATPLASGEGLMTADQRSATPPGCEEVLWFVPPTLAPFSPDFLLFLKAVTKIKSFTGQLLRNIYILKIWTNKPNFYNILCDLVWGFICPVVKKEREGKGNRFRTELFHFNKLKNTNRINVKDY